jgi:hypothetical protein
MVLFHDVVEVLHLLDHDGGAVLCVVALDGSFIGLTAIDGKRFRQSVSRQLTHTDGWRRWNASASVGLYVMPHRLIVE